MTSSIAEFVVSLGSDGRIRSQGSVSDALAKDNALRKELKEEKEAIEKAQHGMEAAEDPAEEVQGEAAKQAAGKLIIAEEMAEGHVGWPASTLVLKFPAFISDERAAVKMYFTSLGGKWPVPFWGFMLSALFACELSNIVQTWFLGYW